MAITTRTRARAEDLLPTAAPTAALLARRSLESNLGALTTTFNPPSDCNTLLLRTLIESALDGTGQWYFDYGLTCTVGDDGDATTFLPESCYPGALAEWYNGNADDNILNRADLAAFSPGSVCPAGYEVACLFTRTTGGTHSEPESATTTDAYDLWNMLKDGETAAGCCPECVTVPISPPLLLAPARVASSLKIGVLTLPARPGTTTATPSPIAGASRPTRPTNP
jgi:hypothetical protein